jgi:two-component system, LytTR family, sensor kinase
MKKSAVILLHTGYWLCYLFLFSVLGLFLHGHFIFRNLSLFIFLAVFAFIPGIIGFYSFYNFLFPRFLKRKKIIALILSGILIAACCGLTGWGLLNLAWSHIGPNNKAPLNQGGYSEIIGLTGAISVNALLNGTVGLVMRGFISWYADIKLKEELNKKNYEMELALVKSQINPHFLFNTINNIDVLIEKDAAKASAYLNKLSGILRFMLYETKTEKIPLANELTYIEKYLDLQKIRTSNPDYIKYTVEGNAGNHMIAPMLFIPFIENAFKHAENKKTETAIDIRFVIEKDSLIFNCENKYNAVPPVKPDHSGLGNELIQRRLALLYPGKHSLQVTNKNGTYRVKLTLTGNED